MRKIRWESWMKEYDVDYLAGVKSYALLDKKNGLIQMVSDVDDANFLVGRLRTAVGDYSLELEDFDYVEIEDAASELPF